MYRRSLAYGTFGPYLAAVLANDALYNGKAHTGSFELLGMMQALEDTEGLLFVLGIEAHAIVTDNDVVVVGFRDMIDVDGRLLLRPCEFEGVGEQVVQDHLEHRCVGVRLGSWFHVHMHLVRPLIRYRVGNGFARELPQVQLFALQ